MMWYSYQNSKVVGLKKGWRTHTHIHTHTHTYIHKYTHTHTQI